jgi:quercetin dioxygenase-like cupin family protein
MTWICTPDFSGGGTEGVTTRDRLDLVTENVPVGARAIRADRIRYHPGDTAAAHYHTDCHHVFCVLAGSGLLYDGEHAHRLNAEDSALNNLWYQARPLVADWLAETL